MRDIENGDNLVLDFEKLKKVAACGQALLPVAVQDADSNEVLIVAYVNEAALAHTLEHRVATFWSTTRNELWTKGTTSGDCLDLIEVRVNCEQNSLLYRVRSSKGGACHTRDANGRTRRSCYYRRLDGSRLKFLS